ncbi:serine/threonine-protein kinase PknK [Anaerolineae bacterium]|nr:serine/threonine-protein kinase PknK [Anaerolineae bacterium]
MMSPCTAKVALPSRSRLLLHRSRLVDFLHDHVDRRLIVVSAPTGYGKTSLLIDFAYETPLPVCWYSLEPLDRDPQVFLEYFIASIRCRFPAVGERAQKALASGTTIENFDAVIGALTSEIQKNVSSRFVIAFDDYHQVADVDAINRLINLLLARFPSKVHFVIASRTVPMKLNLAPLQTHQQVMSLGIGELQFTAEELHAFVRQNYQIELSTEQASELATRTEGWIAGILLTTPILWPGIYQQFIRDQGTHEDVFRFLASETFEHLPAELQRFLLDVSIFSRIEITTCNTVFETTDADKFLRAIETRNLFLVRLADESGKPMYRFHTLFHEFLRRRLSETDPTRWRTLNQRAAEFFEARDGHIGQAIAHYLAAEMFEDAARLIEQIAQSTFDAGRWTSLAAWIDALPIQILENHPRLIVIRGMVFAEMGKNVEAENSYARAIQLYQARKDQVSAAKAVVWRAMLWNLAGRYREAVTACENALEILHRHHAQSDEARAYRILGSAHMHLGQYSQCVSELEKGLELYQALGDETRVAWLHHDIGRCLRILGNPQADEHYQQALEFWRRTDNVVGMAITLNNIGVGYHRAGDHERALTTLGEARAMARRIGSRRSEEYALCSLGDVYRDQCEIVRALELYHQSVELGRGVDGFLLTYALTVLGETYRSSGDETKAGDYLNQALASAESHESNYELGLVETALGIFEYQCGQTDAALAHLRRAVDLLKSMRPDCLRARLHLARTCLLERNFDLVQKQLAAIATQSVAMEPTRIPFIVADQALLQPVIRYAVSKGIRREYFSQLSELFSSWDKALEQPSEPRIEIRALGVSRVTVGDKMIGKSDWGTSVAKELFFLLLEHPQGIFKEKTLEIFWLKKPMDAASKIFNTTTSRLRHIVPNMLNNSNGLYAVRPELYSNYDVAQFEEWIERAQDAKGVTERIEAYQAAVALYQGDFLEECYSDWAMSIRTRLRQKYLNALVGLAQLYERHGDVNIAMEYYQTLLEKDRDREEIYRAVMRLQFKQGDRVAAVRTYRRCAEVLRDELNVPNPSQETQDLYRMICEDVTA